MGLWGVFLTRLSTDLLPTLRLLAQQPRAAFASLCNAVLLIISAEHGAIAGDTKVKSEDQPGDSLEAELTRVRARRLTRAERPQYLGNAEFEEEVCLMPCYCLSLLYLDTKHITELSS